MKKRFIVGIFLLINIYSFGQNKYLKDVNDTQLFSEKVVDLFAENKIKQSFNTLSEYWPLPKNEIKNLEKATVEHLSFIEKQFGKSIGTLKVRNETISDFAIQETYLIRYDISAIRLIFTYYKGYKGWVLNGFKWDLEFTQEFK